MKKFGLFILIAVTGVMVSVITYAQAQVAEKQSEQAAPAATSTAAQVPVAQKAQKQAAPAAALAPTAVQPGLSPDIVRNRALENAKAALDSQEWTVHLSLANGRRPKDSTDVLTFKEGKVTSKNLLAQGYPESNYTLSVTGDGVAVWETMQVNEKVGLAFLRGELHGMMMKGAISMQPQKGEKSTLYFSSEIPSQAPVVQEEPPQQKKKGKK